MRNIQTAPQEVLGRKPHLGGTEDTGELLLLMWTQSPHSSIPGGLGEEEQFESHGPVSILTPQAQPGDNGIRLLKNFEITS